MCEEAPIVGIDLGTTYSCVAVVRNDQVEVIHGDNGNHITASCVYFNNATGERIVGDAAKEKRTRDPQNIIYGVKRILGRSYEEYEKQKNQTLFSYIIEEENKKPKIAIDLNGETTKFAPEEISAMVLGKLKERAEEFLGKPVTKAVVTVPAHFNEAQRHATKIAGQIAGLEIVRLINEPTAAALAYELHNKYKESTGCNILIYDFGGGTFDISIVSIEEGIIDVKATNGEAYLGGDDIDLCIAKHIMDNFNKKHNTDISNDKRAFRRILQQAEKVKRLLSTNLTASIELDQLHGALDLILTVSRAELESWCMELFKKSMDCVELTLKEAKMTKADIGEIVLVGGSTRIPRIREMIRKFFNNKEINASLNPDEAVAIGAARQAAILAGSESERIGSVLLYDIISLSLGIEVEGELMSVIIHKNSKLPCSSSKVYETAEHNQTEVDISIYEGERTMVADNRKLGEFELSGIRPAPIGEIKILVTFEVDTNGMLNVTAVDKDSNNTNNITVKSHKGHLSESEILQMIAQAELFREEDERRKEAVEAKINLQKKCYDMISESQDLDIEQNQKIKKKCEEILTWIMLNENLSKDEYVARKEEILSLTSSYN